MTPETRKELLKRSKAHLKADMLLKGTYASNGQGFRGCSIGCHLHDIYPEMSIPEVEDLSDKHQRVSEHYGYPEWLARLQDTIFEGLPKDVAPEWHVELAEVLNKTPDDYDWQAALHRVHIAILRTALNASGSAKEVVETVIDLHERAASGENVPDELWSAAWSAAWSARAAAWSAARAAAWSAEAAARSAARSAEAAARSAASSAAWFAAWSAEAAAFEEIRDGVLSALSERQANG